MAAIGPRRDRSRVDVPSAPGGGTLEQRTTLALGQLVNRVPVTGTAILNFGAFPGASDASFDVTDQTGIVESSIVHAELRPVATPDHTADEHLVEPIRILAANIAPGKGFSIYGIYAGPGDALVYGQWTVAWSWS